MSGSEKGAVDLLLEDTARQLEKAGVTDTGQAAPSLLDYTRLWQAVLYLTRAVKELAEREKKQIAGSLAETLAMQAGTAVVALKNLRACFHTASLNPKLDGEILKIIAVLRGESS